MVHSEDDWKLEEWAYFTFQDFEQNWNSFFLDI